MHIIHYVTCSLSLAVPLPCLDLYFFFCELSYLICLFFFFSSRRRHTRCLSDWSSDVCSSDLIHQHPAANGAAIGDTSHRDFRRLAASLVRLHDGGVVLNCGSAVIMPEVFLKDRKSVV